MKFYVRRDMDKHCRMALTSIHNDDINRIRKDIYAEYLDELEIYDWCKHPVTFRLTDDGEHLNFMLISDLTGEVLKNTTVDMRIE